MDFYPFAWLWLFPATYAIHIAEEGFAGERFYRWLRHVPVSRVLGLHFGARGFFAANGVFMLAMLAAVGFARAPGLSWLVPALGTVTAVNGLGHLGGCVLTRRYSPGTVSGLLLWVPLGIFALVWSWHRLPQDLFVVGVAAGVLAHVAVFAIALAVGLAGRRARTA